MVNGKWLPILQSAGKHQLSISFVCHYPCQIRVHQRWQSSYSSEEGVAASHSGRFIPGGLPVNTVIHTTLVDLELTTFRLLVRRATNSATDSPQDLMIWFWLVLDSHCHSDWPSEFQGYSLLVKICVFDFQVHSVSINEIHPTSLMKHWNRVNSGACNCFDVRGCIRFRLQPNLDTRQKQIDAWTSLVLAYHRHHKKYTLDVTEIQSSPLFNNTSIDSIFCVLYIAWMMLRCLHLACCASDMVYRLM